MHLSLVLFQLLWANYTAFLQCCRLHCCLPRSHLFTFSLPFLVFWFCSDLYVKLYTKLLFFSSSRFDLLTVLLSYTPSECLNEKRAFLKCSSLLSLGNLKLLQHTAIFLNLPCISNHYIRWFPEYFSQQENTLMSMTVCMRDDPKSDCLSYQSPSELINETWQNLEMTWKKLSEVLLGSILDNVIDTNKPCSKFQGLFWLPLLGKSIVLIWIRIVWIHILKIRSCLPSFCIYIGKQNGLQCDMLITIFGKFALIFQCLLHQKDRGIQIISMLLFNTFRSLQVSESYDFQPFQAPFLHIHYGTWG